MQDNIFGPLQMKSTTFRMGDHPELQHRRAQISMRSEPRGPLSPTAAFKPETTELDYGGVGLYSTAADYAKLLGALLNDDSGILTAGSVRELCAPQLPDPKKVEANFYGPMQYIFCPEYPKDLAASYALGGAVNLEDVPGKRRKGSIMWSGLTNGRWVCAI
jgi:CubicO group peptidase (beta-lactamase class C family)